MNRPSIKVTSSKHLERLAELEQIVAEQEIAHANVKEMLQVKTAEMERLKSAIKAQADKQRSMSR